MDFLTILKDAVSHLEKGATKLIKTLPLLNDAKAQEEARKERELFSAEREKIKGAREKLKTEKDYVSEAINKRVEWSFDKVPNTDEVNNNKLMMNAISSAKIMEDIKPNKTKITSTPLVIANTNPTILDLQKQIKCIECSIKKLELNLKLTNEDGINDGELLTLLQEISKLCSNEEGVGCDDDLQSFVDEVILKRDMNSISGLIKLASFMCPILAFANKSLVSELGDKDIDSQSLQGAANICSRIIGYVAETGNDNAPLIENISETVDFIGASHEAGVIEGVVSFVGIGATKSVEIKKKIKSSIISVVRTTIKNTIDKVFKTATKYQQLICMVFITLLSTHILLTMSINGTEAAEAAEAYYSSVIEHAYNTTMTIGNGTMSIGNKTITTGGKKASKSRRAANATKPRATRAANAAKPRNAKAAAAKAAPKKKK
jgi:hypothetical protein